MSDSELLDIIRKERDGAVATTTSLAPWQEPVRKGPAAPAGFGGGSWASAWWREEGVLDASLAIPSGHREFQRNQLGLPGFPEVNFRPYDRETNRIGARGPSFVGRPISFSFFGPTGQSGPMLDVQWVVVDNSATPGGDTLTLDTISPRTTPTTGPIKPIYSVAPAILWLYGSDKIPSSGLYLTVAMTGEPGQVGMNDAGLGDWTIGSDNLTTRDALRARGPESRYEVFRVVDISSNTITLDPGKRLATYFQFPSAAKAIVRLIHLMRPEAARLVPLPQRDNQRSRAYAFVPPARSLPSDLQPPDMQWTFQDPGSPLPWAGNPVQKYQGQLQDYGDAEVLPVRRPLGSGTGHLQGETTDPLPVENPVGRWAFFADQGLRPEVGQVVRIHQVEKILDASIWSAGKSMLLDPGLERLTGWFEVLEVAAPAPGTYLVICRRLIEIDPSTGMPFDASADAFWLDGALPGQRVKLTYTVHPPVSSLWTSDMVDADALESTRLRPLLAPDLVGRSVQGWPDVAGTTPHRPDRAVINTASSGGGRAGTNANPGSLLELGFRAVLFPARVGPGGTLEPDFDRPIASREVTLDLTVSEPQWWDVDYVEGILRLSHAPVPGPSCDLCPDPRTLSTPDNPRREVVVFASFVPASVENEGDVTLFGSADPGIEVDPCGAGGYDTAPPFSQRVVMPVTPQVITVPAYPDRIDLDLDFPYSPVAIPLSGVVDLVVGTSAEGPPLFGSGDPSVRASSFHYESFVAWGGGPRPKIRLLNCSGGGVAGDTQTVTMMNPATAVLRRHYARSGTNPQVDYRLDLAYGRAARTQGIRFPGAKVTWHGDGTATVDTRTHEAAPLFHDLFSPNILQGCRPAPAGGLVVTIDPGWALIGGRRVPVRNRLAVVPDNTTSYVYLVGADPCDVRLSVSGIARPLPGRDDILVARVHASGGAVTQILDLRYPLREIDYRLDVIVGRRHDLLPYGIPEPHFSSVADAVGFVGELIDPEVGLSGYQVRIRVAGMTEERDSAMPIQMPCDGLVIEGVAASDFTQSDPSGIGWGHPDAALFDIRGHNGCEFRNLRIRYIDRGQPLNPVPSRVAFVSSAPGNLIDRLVIDGINMDGANRAHGMFLLRPPVTLLNSTVRRCFANRITDFGVLLNRSNGCLIDACSFRQEAPAQTPIPNQAGVSLGLTGDLGMGNVVRACSAAGFQTGYYTDGTRDNFSECAALGSQGPGFVIGALAGAGVTFDRCTGRELAFDVALLPRVAFHVRGGEMPVVSGCRADMAAVVPGADGFRSDVPLVRVVDFSTNADVMLGPQNQGDRIIATGSIKLNREAVLTDSRASTLQASSGNLVKGFVEIVAGNSTVGDGCIVTGCVFKSLLVGGVFTRFVDCDIEALVGASSPLPQFINCLFRSPTTVVGDGGTFRGCQLVQTLDLSGSGNLVESCTFFDKANLLVRGALPARGVGNVLRGNRFTGEGGIWIDGDQCEVDGNRMVSFETTSGTVLSIVATGQQIMVRGNRALFGIGVGVVAGGMTEECIVNDNWSATLTVRAPRSVITGNAASVLLVDAECVVSGGRYQSVEFLSDFGILAGSDVSGTVTVDAGTLVQSGSRVRGQLKLSAGGTRSALVGNHLAAVILDGHVGTVMTGNTSGAVSANAAHQSILTGNSVVSGGIAAKSNLIILVGNAARGADILLPRDVPASFVVVGNSARNIVADGGADPDPAPPHKSLVTGNRASLLFGGAPDGQGRRNNVAP